MGERLASVVGIYPLPAVINGAGAAGCAIGRQLLNVGVKDLIMVDNSALFAKATSRSRMHTRQLQR